MYWASGLWALRFSPVNSAEEAARELSHLAKANYAHHLYHRAACRPTAREIAHYDDQISPAVIPIPGKSGSLGLGSSALQRAMERAVGANIL